MWDEMKLLTILLAAFGVFAPQLAGANHVVVNKAWVRTTVPGQVVTSAYMDITAKEAARLVSVHTPISHKAEIHLMQMNGNIMRMRQLKALDLPKNGVVRLTPGGYHLMLMKLKKPIKAGDNIPLTLVIDTRGKRELITVQAIAQQNSPEQSDHDHDHKHH